MPPDRPTHRRSRAAVVGVASGVAALLAGLGAAFAAGPGTAGQGDPWAHDYTAAQYASRLQALDGGSSGVGLRLRIDRDRLIVADVEQGSSADAAGVRAGEQVVALDGRSVVGGDLPDVVRQLRDGAVAATVSGPSGVRDISMAPSVGKQQSVSTIDLGAGIRVVRVGAVVRGSADRVGDALTHAASEADCTGAVLDLRGNGGGLVTEAVDLAGVFLDGGRGVTYSTADGSSRTLVVPERDGAIAAPLVVLVDDGTASAAEIVAGILQDRGRAVVIGAQTFGKGTVQEPEALHGGKVRERTVGTYTLPSGRGIDGIGITPDVVLPSDASEADVMDTAASVLAGLAPTAAPER